MSRDFRPPNSNLFRPLINRLKYFQIQTHRGIKIRLSEPPPFILQISSSMIVEFPNKKDSNLTSKIGLCGGLQPTAESDKNSNISVKLKPNLKIFYPIYSIRGFESGKKIGGISHGTFPNLT